jgi:hypothetical protein
MTTYPPPKRSTVQTHQRDTTRTTISQQQPTASQSSSASITKTHLQTSFDVVVASKRRARYKPTSRIYTQLDIMGPKQSVLTEDDSIIEEEQEGPCHCFFLGGAGVKPKSRSRSSDPMGTPLPVTPMHTRRKRERILEEARNNPVMMSQYGGLEKETEAYYSTDLISPAKNGGAKNGGSKKNEPGIYDGPVSKRSCERLGRLLCI